MKKSLYLFYFVLMSNCAMSSNALLGPAITGAKSGNIYQASISFGQGRALDLVNREFKKLEKLKTLGIKKSISFKETYLNPPVLVVLNLHPIKISKIAEPEPLP